MTSRAQIIATIGPASENAQVLQVMLESGMDAARFNFAWFDPTETRTRVAQIRAGETAAGKQVLLIADMPGPRIPSEAGHTYDAATPFAITAHDTEMLRFVADEQFAYVALSFIGSAEEVCAYQAAIAAVGGTQKVIAKIERSQAVAAFDEIVDAADAVMIARGDLGNEVPLEEIPFVQKQIIAKANALGKPVIVATQMLLSMREHPEPTRAEVTDVEAAISDGADAVMLSEETASGAYPIEAVRMMERIVSAAERHQGDHPYHLL